jgi:hypothetical protein
MAIQLGSAYGKVGLDVKGLLDAVKQGKAGMMSLADMGEQVGAGLKRAGQAMTVGLTLPILAMGAASIKAASDFEETKNKAVVVFGEMADSVVSNANRAAVSMGISKTQYLDYAASIGVALSAGGMGIKQSTELAEGAVKHFADLASFHNARVEDVALAWQSAIRGQYEPIQRYFPFINDAYLKTYGMANGMLDANTKNLTANQRAVILNAIALDSKLNPALNDFAETSSGLANSSRIMKAQLSDAAVMLGQNLLPIALQVVTALNKMLIAFNNLSPFQQKMILGFLGILAVLGPLLTMLGTVISVISGIAGLAGSLSGLGISIGSIGAALTALAPVAAAVGAALLPILLIIGAIALQAGLLYLAWKFNFLGMRDNITMWVKVVKSLWAAFTAFLRGDTDAAMEHLGAAFEAIKERMAKIFNFAGFAASFQNFMGWLRNALTSVRNYISTAFTNVNWGTVGKYILLGLANGMLLGLPALLAIVVRVATSVLATIKRSLGISSPSKEAMKLGAFTAQGFALGMQTMNPEDITRALTKPITQNSSSQQQTIIQNFSGGVTLKEVRGLIAANNEELVNTMVGALSG